MNWLIGKMYQWSYFDMVKHLFIEILCYNERTAVLYGPIH